MQKWFKTFSRSILVIKLLFAYENNTLNDYAEFSFTIFSKNKNINSYNGC